LTADTYISNYFYNDSLLINDFLCVPVDEKERSNGNDPVKEIRENDFQDYQRGSVKNYALLVDDEEEEEA